MIDLHNPFNLLIIQPILNALVAIYQILLAIHIPFALGFAIILLTAIIRLIIAPLTAAQLKSSAQMQKLTPNLNKLKEKHKNDAKMLQSETMRLYKEHGINPAAGCLPVIVQLPVIWGLYSVLQRIVGDPHKVMMQINTIVYSPALRLHTVWDTNFFGLSLGKAPSQLLTSFGVFIFLFPIATAFFQLIQSKMMFAPVLPVEEGKDKGAKSDDMAAALQMQSLYIFPLMIGFFSYTLPLGLTLYWNTFTIFGIIQQYQLQGWGGLSEWMNKIKRR